MATRRRVRRFTYDCACSRKRSTGSMRISARNKNKQRLSPRAEGMLFRGPLFGLARIDADIAGIEQQMTSLKSLSQWSVFKEAMWLTFIVIVALSVYGGWGLVRGDDRSVVKRAKLVLWL